MLAEKQPDFFQCVDDIAARLTRLLGVGIAIAVVSASTNKAWETALSPYIKLIGLDDLLRNLATLALIIFALIQGVGVITLLAKYLRAASLTYNWAGKIAVTAIALAIIPIAAVTIATLNDVAFQKATP